MLAALLAACVILEWAAFGRRLPLVTSSGCCGCISVNMVYLEVLGQDTDDSRMPTSGTVSALHVTKQGMRASYFVFNMSFYIRTVSSNLRSTRRSTVQERPRAPQWGSIRRAEFSWTAALTG